MEDTNEVVAKLSVELDETMVVVEQEKAATNELIAVVDAQAADAAREEAVAKEREDETNVEAGKAQAKMDAAEVELKQAVPLILEAEEAVNCLNKPAIDELKSFGSPSAAVLLVVKAILTLYKGEKRNYGWDNGKKMMKDPNAFLAALKSFDKENIPDWVVDAMDKILEEPNYNEATMKKSSTAAASLCVWSIAVCKYNKVYKYVKPLEDEAAAAKAVADQKLAELAVV
jgi:dynein heavy chain